MFCTLKTTNDGNKKHKQTLCIKLTCHRLVFVFSVWGVWEFIFAYIDCFVLDCKTELKYGLVKQIWFILLSTFPGCSSHFMILNMNNDSFFFYL